MEKVTVEIGHPGRHSSKKHPDSCVTCANRINSLADTLEISRERAQSLVSKLDNHNQGSCSTRITVELTYRQVGRYSAFREVEDPGYPDFWSRARIMDVIEEEEPDESPRPIELRPGKRLTP